MDYNCLNCIYFRSYEDEYYDDLEPWDIGRCMNEHVQHYYEQVDEDNWCDEHILIGSE